MPKRHAVQPTPPGLAMSYVPDLRIVDGGQITPRRRDSPLKPDEDPNMVKEGSTSQANALYYYKLIQQWLHKGDIVRWTNEVTDWANSLHRSPPYFFDKNCIPGEENYKAPWTLKVPVDALRTPGSRIAEEGNVQIVAQGLDDITYEVARCPLWAAIQLLQHHKFLERGMKVEEVIRTFAPSNLRLPYDESPVYSDEDYPDFPGEDYPDDDDGYEEDED